MKVVRFSAGGDPKYAALEEKSTKLVVLKGDPLFQTVEPSGEILELDDVRLLSPMIPRSKVLGAAFNFRNPANPGAEEPKEPIVFMKPNTAVIGPDDPIVLPEWTNEVVFETEVAVIIKTLCKDVKAADAQDVIFGYTIANDVTARDRLLADRTMLRAKTFDTSCPVGPWITIDPELDVYNLAVTTRINGEVVHQGNTRDMIHKIPALIEYISHTCTLLPGDMILVGTPAGNGEIKAGDVVECEIEGLGVLRNQVVRR
ncbi:fumarylacetoacetate hydrolase family protein [Gleimia coleocanis]|nr:fumarylacetoacetate hydrolase family protein [Gleimia coleocanis]